MRKLSELSAAPSEMSKRIITFTEVGDMSEMRKIIESNEWI